MFSRKLFSYIIESGKKWGYLRIMGPRAAILGKFPILMRDWIGRLRRGRGVPINSFTDSSFCGAGKNVGRQRISAKIRIPSTSASLSLYYCAIENDLRGSSKTLQRGERRKAAKTSCFWLAPERNSQKCRNHKPKLVYLVRTSDLPSPYDSKPNNVYIQYLDVEKSILVY